MPKTRALCQGKLCYFWWEKKVGLLKLCSRLCNLVSQTQNYWVVVPIVKCTTLSFFLSPYIKKKGVKERYDIIFQDILWIVKIYNCKFLVKKCHINIFVNCMYKVLLITTWLFFQLYGKLICPELSFKYTVKSKLMTICWEINDLFEIFIYLHFFTKVQTYLFKEIGEFRISKINT